ncbi:hypothetical protein X975_07558, partial [Stegodyphus mimosarum]
MVAFTCQLTEQEQEEISTESLFLGKEESMENQLMLLFLFYIDCSLPTRDALQMLKEGVYHWSNNFQKHYK